jgi:hypothetical protein
VRLGRVEVVPELALEHAVDAADLLLLAQLETEVPDLAAPDAVLTGRGLAALEGAFLRIAASALEEELQPLAATETAGGCGVACLGVPATISRGGVCARGSRCVGWG